MLRAKLLRKETLAILQALILITGCDTDQHNQIEKPLPKRLDSTAVAPTTTPESVPDAAPASGIPAFLELRQAARSGHYTNGAELNQFAILESLGGGVALVDIDGDRFTDIVYPQGGIPGPETIRGNPNLALRNLGDLRFQDVSEQFGLAAQVHYSHGALHCDVNQDGFADILITGYGGLSFFSNQGDGTFIEISQHCGLTDSLWSSSAACGDVTGDGIEDFHIAHYVDWSLTNDPHCYADQMRDVCPPREFQGVSDRLLVSDGSGSFSDLPCSPPDRQWLSAFL